MAVTTSPAPRPIRNRFVELLRLPHRWPLLLRIEELLFVLFFGWMLYVSWSHGVWQKIGLHSGMIQRFFLVHDRYGRLCAARAQTKWISGDS